MRNLESRGVQTTLWAPRIFFFQAVQLVAALAARHFGIAARQQHNEQPTHCHDDHLAVQDELKTGERARFAARPSTDGSLQHRNRGHAQKPERKRAPPEQPTTVPEAVVPDQQGIERENHHGLSEHIVKPLDFNRK